MTTSPEALREAVERLTASANGENQLTIGRNVFVQMTDLTLVLSALQEARKALGPFAAATGPIAAIVMTPMTNSNIVNCQVGAWDI